MIDLEEYEDLFQKIEDLFQGLTDIETEDEKEIFVERRRDICLPSIALADERDDIDTDFDYLFRETEDKISAELSELNDLMRSTTSADGSKGDVRETRGSLDSRTIEKIGRESKSSKEADKDTMQQIEILWKISSQKQDSCDGVHIFRSLSQLDSTDTTLCGAWSFDRDTIAEEKEEAVRYRDDLEIEIGLFEKLTLERGLRKTYPLEFPGRSPLPPDSAHSLLYREPSITSSSSSDESSLIWLSSD